MPVKYSIFTFSIGQIGKESVLHEKGRWLCRVAFESSAHFLDENFFEMLYVTFPKDEAW